MRIGLVHYSYAPVVGGVEAVMRQQAELFARRGHAVRVVCGAGGPAASTGAGDGDRSGGGGGVEVRVVPALAGCGGPAGARVGQVGELVAALRRDLDGCDIVFVHNVMTMPFNPVASGALWEAAALEPGMRWVNWTHDVGAAASGVDRVPFSTDAGRFEYVAVSEPRRDLFARWSGVPPEHCTVVPNGVSPEESLRLSGPVASLWGELGLARREVVLFQPARLLRRKNIEFGIGVLAALRRSGSDAVYLVSGAPEPHGSPSAVAPSELEDLATRLGVAREFVLVGQRFTVGDDDLASLYAACDAVFVPSLEEGFGLPLLEGGLFRVPVFCADREPMRSVGGASVTLIDPDRAPAEAADLVLATLRDNPGCVARKETLTRYSWDGVYDRHIRPLLCGHRESEGSFTAPAAWPALRRDTGATPARDQLA